MKRQRIVTVHFSLDSQLSNSVLNGQMFYKRSLLFVCLCIYAVFFFLTMPQGMWDLSSLTKDQTCVSHSGVTKS